MTTRKYSSRSQQTTLAAGITDTATSCTVVSGTTLLGGATVPSGTTFTVVIDPDTALEEIVDVTVVSTNVLTITRGVENAGTGQAHSAGAAVRHMAIGRDFREANLHIEATGGYNDGTGAHTMHGIAAGEGVVVGTDKSQTLTNKTLTAPIITNPSITGAGVDASIVFEGATPDAFETTLTVTDPTQDNTITLPNTTGTVVIANAAQTLTNKTMGDALNAGGFKITNLATPTLASDAVRKDFADAQVAAAATSAASASTSASSAATSAASALTSANSASASQIAAATSAASAATSASTMAASVTAAASSATAAATSATSAAASATAASSSATAASTSATSAAASATAAATSATSAAASATTAANSVATIAGFATTASNSASAAATSASSAATSAASAAVSQGDASGFAASAALSATDAGVAESAAATSATSAAASATAAATSATSAAASAASAAAAVAASFDAKGDLLVGTGADAFLPLPVATTSGYVLSVNSATTTGLEWAAAAAGYTAPVLGTTTVTSGATISNVNGLTINSTVIPTSKTLVATDTTDFVKTAGGSVISANTSGNALEIRQTGAGNALVVEDSDNPDSTPLVITTDGRLFVGTTTDLALTGTGIVQVANTASTQIQVARFSNDTGGPVLSFGKSRGTTIPSQGLVQSGDSLGQIIWRGNDGANSIAGAILTGEVDGTTGTNDMPTRLIFATTSDNANSPTERLRIDSAGRVIIPANGVLDAPYTTTTTSGAYTFIASDSGKLVEGSGASAYSFTVPPNSSVPYPTGSQINILQTGAGQITIAPGSGVTINGTPGLKLRAQWSSATLIKRGTDTWVLIGDIVA